MNIANAYFITVTAYAGKSTIVKLLAEKHNGIACRENYHDALLEGLHAALSQYTPEFITVYYGEGVTESDADSVAAVLTGIFPEAELSVVDGGQPVYYYMISVE